MELYLSIEDNSPYQIFVIVAKLYNEKLFEKISIILKFLFNFQWAKVNRDKLKILEVGNLIKVLHFLFYFRKNILF